MKKKDKILIGIIGTAGLGLLAYYLMKKSAGQPSPQPSPTPSPTPTPTPQPIPIKPQPQPQPSGNLAITNYKLSFNQITHNIIIQGTVLYNNNPLPHQLLTVGFCGDYPIGFMTMTDANGNFNYSLYTATPSGGANCIYAEVKYNGQTAKVNATIQIPYIQPR